MKAVGEKKCRAPTLIAVNNRVSRRGERTSLRQCTSLEPRAAGEGWAQGGQRAPGARGRPQRAERARPRRGGKREARAAASRGPRTSGPAARTLTGGSMAAAGAGAADLPRGRRRRSLLGAAAAPRGRRAWGAGGVRWARAARGRREAGGGEGGRGRAGAPLRARTPRLPRARMPPGGCGRRRRVWKRACGCGRPRSW